MPEANEVKKLVLLGLMLAIAGCAAAKKEETVLRARDASMDAAAQKLIVTRSTSVDGHPRVTDLGQIQGRCGNDPTGQDTFAGENLREAAIRQYGDKVNAITNAYGWFVVGNTASLAQEPGSSEGHFECSGTAVHFDETASSTK
jgi:hypothetical protein